MSSSAANEIDEIIDKCGYLGDQDSDFTVIDFESSKSLGDDYLHACHGMVFARSHNVLWNSFHTKGCVLMQVRFDGVLGFPGGFVEKGEDLVIGLNREMEEEIGLNVARHGFTAADHLESVVHGGKKNVLHFFTKEVTEDEFLELERNNLAAAEYGIEVMGVLRVPLFTMSEGLRGLPAFLANQFVGNARSQLLKGLQHSKLLSPEEIMQAVKSSAAYVQSKMEKSRK